MSLGLLLNTLSVGVLSLWFVVILVFRRHLSNIWCEPVFRYPILIVESDDWGPGPESHAHSLASICNLLMSHRDETGHPAVMTIGVVLAIPDNASIRSNEFSEYIRSNLTNSEFDAVRLALIEGYGKGVLALQLHGLEHLWPSALMCAAVNSSEVKNWIVSKQGSDTESLPSSIQSRWIDGSNLPSKELSDHEINIAVDVEISTYRECFNVSPTVVVPPTFIWNGLVEEAWARNGVGTVITPGRRYTGRDVNGLPCSADRQIVNGDISEDGGMAYLVRDVYFEPSLGHRAGDVLRQVHAHIRLGRPALLETHRFNFIGDDVKQNSSLNELDCLLSLALCYWPTTRFLSSEELDAHIKAKDGELLEQKLWVRIWIWVKRLEQIGRLRKLAWMTGLVFPFGLLLLALKPFATNYRAVSEGTIT